METIIVSAFLFSALLGTIVSYAMLMSLLGKDFSPHKVRTLSLLKVVTYGLVIVADILYTKQLYLGGIADALAVNAPSLSQFMKPLTDALLATAFLAAIFVHYTLHKGIENPVTKTHIAVVGSAAGLTASIALLMAIMAIHAFA